MITFCMFVCVVCFVFCMFVFVCVFIVRDDLYISTSTTSSTGSSTLSDDVFMDQDAAAADAKINTVISLLQQVAALMQQAVNAISALKE